MPGPAVGYRAAMTTKTWKGPRLAVAALALFALALPTLPVMGQAVVRRRSGRVVSVGFVPLATCGGTGPSR